MQTTVVVFAGAGKSLPPRLARPVGIALHFPRSREFRPAASTLARPVRGTAIAHGVFPTPPSTRRHGGSRALTGGMRIPALANANMAAPPGTRSPA